ncbi:uncharacterized protein DS421_1g08570 [Arachis hypogaea]|nr:uncharacterized protein DS421_1g08570 [Arachis hypogaea]
MIDMEGIEETKMENGNVIECTGSDDTDLVDELPDHSCFVEDEIPRVEMRFEHLKLV